MPLLTDEELIASAERVASKRCNDCCALKSVGAFARNRTAGDGLQRRCRSCHSARMKEHYRRLRESEGRSPRFVDRWVEGRHYEIAASGCWIWASARTREHYGLGKRNGRAVSAHRQAYEDANGPIPRGYEIHHTCRTPACVNPAHLEALTVAQHRALRGRAKRTHPDAFLTDEQAQEIRTLRLAGLTYGAIGAEFGVSLWVVRNIVTGRSYV